MFFIKIHKPVKSTDQSYSNFIRSSNPPMLVSHKSHKVQLLNQVYSQCFNYKRLKFGHLPSGNGTAFWISPEIAATGWDDCHWPGNRFPQPSSHQQQHREIGDSQHLRCGLKGKLKCWKHLSQGALKCRQGEQRQLQHWVFFSEELHSVEEYTELFS